MTPKAMTNDELRIIRDDDEVAGEDIQCCPRAWQQRRNLLAHIAWLEDQLTALSVPNVHILPDGTITTAEGVKADPLTGVVAGHLRLL